MTETNALPAIHAKPLPRSSALLFLASVLLQVGGMALWPLTRGFTEPLPALACVVAQLVAVWLLCRLLYEGVSLSSLIPLASAVVPMAASAVGVLLYAEPISLAKVVLLVGACALIGLAR